MSKQLFDSVMRDAGTAQSRLRMMQLEKPRMATCKKRIGLVVWDARRVIENALCSHDLSNGQGAEKS
eukprot:scaffold5408_cov129-Skeletonema_dohrnii-CCMP3373.AAC.5